MLIGIRPAKPLFLCQLGLDPAQPRYPLVPHEDLSLQGVGVNRYEPASVSVPTGPPSQRFHNPTQNKERQ